MPSKKTSPIKNKSVKLSKNARFANKIEEKIICGQTEGVIRKAYFEKRLPDLLNQIQAEAKYDLGEIEELGNFLNSIKDESKSVVDKLLEVFGGEVIGNGNPPSVDELMGGVDDSEWKEKSLKAVAFIENTLSKVREGIANKGQFAANFWSDTALTFISMQDIIDKDLIFKRQLYKAKLTKIIDEFGVSRKEAEERAELTKEYFEYQVLDKLSHKLEEFYTFARRRDDENNHR